MASYGWFRKPSWDPECDSTWEEEDEDEDDEGTEKNKEMQYQYNCWNRAAVALKDYRHGYKRFGGARDLQTDNTDEMPNLLFYQNKKPFEPHGVKIEEFHEKWRDDYDELERNHDFIQWLFPMREPGMNPYATPLTLIEIEEMKKDPEVMMRFRESYKIMLGFYGIILLEEDSGKVGRADNWKDRFDNLNNHTHNNLRITRILKCLGELGFDHFQAPLVMFFLEETLGKSNLLNVKKSALDYFMFTVKDKKKRRELVLLAWKYYEPKEMFIWGPVDKLRKLEPLAISAVATKLTLGNMDDIGAEPNEKKGLLSCLWSVVHPFFICFQCIFHPFFVCLRFCLRPVYIALWYVFSPIFIYLRLFFRSVLGCFRTVFCPVCRRLKTFLGTAVKSDRNKSVKADKKPYAERRLAIRKKGTGIDHQLKTEKRREPPLLLAEDMEKRVTLGENRQPVKRKTKTETFPAKQSKIKEENLLIKSGAEGKGTDKTGDSNSEKQILSSMSSDIGPPQGSLPENQGLIRQSIKDSRNDEILKDSKLENQNLQSLINKEDINVQKLEDGKPEKLELPGQSSEEEKSDMLPEDSTLEKLDLLKQSIEEDIDDERLEDCNPENKNINDKIAEDSTLEKQDMLGQSSEESRDVEVSEDGKPGHQNLIGKCSTKDGNVETLEDGEPNKLNLGRQFSEKGRYVEIPEDSKSGNQNLLRQSNEEERNTMIAEDGKLDKQDLVGKSSEKDTDDQMLEDSKLGSQNLVRCRKEDRNFKILEDHEPDKISEDSKLDKEDLERQSSEEGRDVQIPEGSKPGSQILPRQHNEEETSITITEDGNLEEQDKLRQSSEEDRNVEILQNIKSGNEALVRKCSKEDENINMLEETNQILERLSSEKDRNVEKPEDNRLGDQNLIKQSWEKDENVEIPEDAKLEKQNLLRWPSEEYSDIDNPHNQNRPAESTDEGRNLEPPEDSKQ